MANITGITKIEKLSIPGHIPFSNLPSVISPALLHSKMSIRDLMTESMWGPETQTPVTALPSIPEPIKEALATSADFVGTTVLGAFNDVAGAILRGADSCAQSARKHIPGGFRAVQHHVYGTPMPIESLDNWIEVPDSKPSINEPKTKTVLYPSELESVPRLIAEAMATSC